MTRSSAALSLLPLVFAAGCAIQSHTDYDPQVEFSAYETFALAPAPESKPEGLIGYSAITARRIEEQIAQALESKGFRKVARSQADLVVAFSVTGEPRTDIVGYGPGWYGNTYSQHYVEGNLVINFYDAKSRQLVWHGWATARIYDPKEGQKRGPEAVEAIMKKFPPS